ncbi:cell division control protein Cdc6 [Pseudovirgaria hyperparasitica]|uniref:Cell division control protein n=1 Tax=Pseudovirgaria hyperparasitica TaxID=470096 RepID=A0A6A6W8R9_9PEZI|nr:cell division control protein Cdc6 [Pseudovirgaria hyperparasitica]KAF2759278.1 cell division control protein Cdc6 [Pseudovirgaria hyperparasitica]
MSASVLGKRTRASLASPDSGVATSSQAKRRANFVILDDNEKENPFVTPSKRLGARHVESMDVDGEELQPRKSKRTRAGTVPAKHGTPESRVPLSPTKITDLFKTSKNVPADSKPVDDFKLPQTPRHRDARLKKPATTPRHRVLVAGKPLTPRTPHTPSNTRSSAITVYNDARQTFAKGTMPTALFGREKERAELEHFVESRLQSTSSGCIYVSGPPGTGKSAFVSETSRKLEAGDVPTAYINCMSMKKAEDIYGKLLEELVTDSEALEGHAIDILRRLFYEKSQSFLVTLDEVDHLLDLDLELLYTLFEWALDAQSSLVLVGIANALDFTDRFLPRLKSRGLKPHLLPFLPYTASQIASVVTSKLRSLVPATASDPNFVPFIHPTAIQFLSKKVAAQSGDLRKSFDICRRAIDLVEADTKDKQLRASDSSISPGVSPSKAALIENMNLSSPPTARSPSKFGKTKVAAQSMSHLTIESAPRATIAHMARITAAVFSNGTSQRLQSLNLQQKAVLCALSALEKKTQHVAPDGVVATPSRRNASAPTVKSLFDAYTGLCKRDNVLHALTNTEFRDIIGSLETLSMITAVEGKGGSLSVATTPSRKGRGGGFGGSVFKDRRIASSIGSKELEASLSGAGSSILKEIMSGEVL